MQERTIGIPGNDPGRTGVKRGRVAEGRNKAGKNDSILVAATVCLGRKL